VVASGQILHLPELGRPFGFDETNLSSYFAVFVRNFEKHGFAELRGVPMGVSVVDTPQAAYMTHPPLRQSVGSGSAEERGQVLRRSAAAQREQYGEGQRHGPRRQLLTFITDPRTIVRILTHLDLPAELPPLAPPRAPPRGATLWLD
jgi:hypothetical protein